MTMALLVVLLILILGYRYTNAITAEKIALRRSNGWETYVKLGDYGLHFIWLALLPYFLFWAGITLLFLALHIITFLKWNFWTAGIALIWTSETAEYIHAGLITLLAFYLCEAEIKKQNQRAPAAQQQDMKKLDAVLNLVIDAAENQRPVKVSLKSRKVYIGIIPGEQFERTDIDNLALIPYYSGHRDKDTLQLTFDSNYIEVYEKNGIFTPDSESVTADSLSRLDNFRIVIRMNEVESISFFDMDAYFSDFNPS